MFKKHMKQDRRGALPVAVLGIIAVVVVVLLAFAALFVSGAFNFDSAGYGGGSGVNKDNVIGYIDVSAVMHIENPSAWLEGVNTHIVSVSGTFVRTSSMSQGAQFAFPDLTAWSQEIYQRASFTVESMSAEYDEGPYTVEWRTSVEPGQSWDFTKRPEGYFFIKSPGVYTITCTLEQWDGSAWVYADAMSNTVVVA
jgi:hypothetical protein